jgi:glycosyltransferase involved in cell wall biosynthesis
MGNKYRLLVVGPENRHIENFVNRLRPETEHIDVISNGPVQLPEDVNLYLTDFSLRKLTNIITTTRCILKTIRLCKPDIIHVHQINTVAFYTVLANLFARKPIVLTAWGSDILLAPERSFIMKCIVRFCLRNADGFTSDSGFMAEKMKTLSGGKPINVEVFNFGVTPLEIPVKKEKIIYSNRLHKPLYRIDKIIRAFALFSKSENGKDWKLVVAATGTETESLLTLAKELQVESQVEFVGFLDSPHNAKNYARSTIFVSIPESDATAVSLLEAMYYQCIPVLSDLPANREWVTDGVNGFIVKDVDAPFLNLIDDSMLETAGKQNKSIISEKATAAVATRNFSELHRKIIQNR